MERIETQTDVLEQMKKELQEYSREKIDGLTREQRIKLATLYGNVDRSIRNINK